MPLKKHAVLVHINPFTSVTPLQGGYLKAYANADPNVRREWDITLYSTPIDTSAFKVIEDLLRLSPDVIGFSCYVWNMGIVRRILPSLYALLPTTYIVLGGVQVVKQAKQYVRPEWDRVIVCNGEGERTFHELLLQLTEPAPDICRVNGITCQVGGESVTTAAQPRIHGLDEIPSPWLTGVFKPTDMTVALFETNRGCPYQCEFCFWGGAVGQKVNRFPLDRIKEELTYIATSPSVVLFVIDANFGIFDHDVEIAEHIARNHRALRRPSRVHFSSAKNHPTRVEEITRVFGDSGLIAAHPISLQTSSPGPLRIAKRSNIKTDNYVTLQRRLNARSVPSFIELIWPLPGETLDSFKNVIDDLCARAAPSIVVYPLLLMNNVGFQEQRDQLGLVTVPEESPASDAEMVIRTNEVSVEDYAQGIRFIIGAEILHVLRGLYASMQLLMADAIMPMRDVVDAFSRWLDASPHVPLARFRQQELDSLDKWCDYRSDGALVEYLLHTARKDCDRALVDFARTLPGVHHPDRAEVFETALEYDLLNRPYAYHNTEFGLGVPLERTAIVEARDGAYVVDLPYDIPSLMRTLATGGTLTDDDWQPMPRRYRVSHRRKQIFRLPEHTGDYLQHCHSLGREIAQFVPTWTALDSPAIATVPDLDSTAALYDAR
jgi:hypothetical protein